MITPETWMIGGNITLMISSFLLGGIGKKLELIAVGCCTDFLIFWRGPGGSHTVVSSEAVSTKGNPALVVISNSCMSNQVK